MINITSGSKIGDKLTKSRFVKILENLLEHEHLGIVEDVLWLISNLVTESHKAKIEFTTSRIFNKIKILIETSKSIRMIKMLTKLISNILHMNKPNLSENIVNND